MRKRTLDKVGSVFRQFADESHQRAAASLAQYAYADKIAQRCEASGLQEEASCINRLVVDLQAVRGRLSVMEVSSYHKDKVIERLSREAEQLKKAAQKAEDKFTAMKWKAREYRDALQAAKGEVPSAPSPSPKGEAA